MGPTGSGKTGIAIKIAKRVGGEIISADSRTIFCGMDVGTAKPSLVERKGVPHWGFDLVQPGERFTVADWKKYAEQKIDEIFARKKVPIVVGGTGLYVDALVFDYQFAAPSKGYGKNRGVSKKVVREDTEKYPDRQEMCSKYKIFGIEWERKELRERLRRRAEQMFSEELYTETRELVQKYGLESRAMTGDVYKIVWRFLRGEITREEAVELTAIKDAQLAKRQMTWFKRNSGISWLPLEKVYADVLKCIQNEQGK